MTSKKSPVVLAYPMITSDCTVLILQIIHDLFNINLHIAAKDTIWYEGDVTLVVVCVIQLYNISISIRKSDFKLLYDYMPAWTIAKLSRLACDLGKQTFPLFLLVRLANLKGILQIISHCMLSTQPPFHLNTPNDRSPKSIHSDLLQAFQVLLAILNQFALFLTGSENARWHPYRLASLATFLNPNTNTLDILGL